MKKIISLLLFFLMTLSNAYANTQVPAATVSTLTNSYHHCLGGSDNNAQTAFNDIDNCFGNVAGSWTLTDGTNTVTGVTHLAITGGTVGGTTPNATLTVTGGGGGTPGGVNTQFQINNSGAFGGGNMYNVGGNVGVGTSSAINSNLVVQGSMAVQGNNTSPFTINGVNVGIGTITPNRTLTVSAASNNTVLTTASTASYGVVNTDPTNGNFGDVAYDTLDTSGNIALGAKISGIFDNHTPSGVSGEMAFLTKNAGTTKEDMRIQANGNVGIGTSKPGALFAIGATSNGGSQSHNLFTVDSTGTITTLGGITSNINSNSINMQNNANPISFGNYSGVAGSSLNFYNDNSSGFMTFQPSSAQTAMILTSAGNLGIGTTVPGYQLQVAGTASTSDLHTPNLIGGITSTYGFNIDPTGGGPLMTFSYGRNVGIGSANPGSLLDVVGGTRTQSFNMPTSASSGYVLTSDSKGNGTWQASGAAAQYWVLGTGNVGIGTVNTNVGIGSLTPGSALDVQGTARMTGFTLSTNPSSGYILTSNGIGVGTWQPNAGNGVVNTGTSGQMGYYASSTNAISGTSSLTSNNTNVGIGTTLYNNELSIKNDASIGASYAGQSAPSNGLIVSGNEGIGTWLPSAQLEVGNQKFDVLSGGNVGIGSINPGQALDVQGTVRMTGFNITSGGATGKVLVSDSSGNGTWGTGGSNYWINNTGNVGIGTTYAVGIGTTSQVNKLNILGNIGIGTTSGDSYLTTAAPLGGLIAYGNFGIGTINPTTPLQVQATTGNIFSTINGTTSESSVSSAGVGTFNGNVVTGGTGQSSFATGAVLNSGLNTSANGGDLIWHSNVGIGTIYALATSGNIGIGTITPTAIEIEGENIGIGTPNSGLGILAVKTAASHAGQVTCWTTGGAIGYCSAASTVVASGNCTCNGI